MNTAASFSMLPQIEIEQAFHISLKIVREFRLDALQKEKPRVFDDIVAYTLNPIATTSQLFPLTDAPSPLANSIYWEKLILVNGDTCSEIIIYHDKRESYLAYLKILPADFGLFSPLIPKLAVRFINNLISKTIAKIASNARSLGNLRISTTLYNPNLAPIFVAQGFKEDRKGAQIVGLPLPAYYYKLLDHKNS
ncbi:hypothetical protein D210916BOD24_11140 [Alteromonas sp. D210916BOD_24]|uniref:hypothetical protein n=1 Tax=Alteromonas sp. D210916BOD_24 TaxID=3157618 RepID=UPI00399CFF97